jgi:hypothetical protein
MAWPGIGCDGGRGRTLCGVDEHHRGAARAGTAIQAEATAAAYEIAFAATVPQPQGWAGPAPLQTQLVSTPGNAPVEAPPTPVTASTPPVPLGHMGAQGEGRAVPQYGFRVLFVARPPAAG